jgi:hypothetical protein
MYVTKTLTKAEPFTYQEDGHLHRAHEILFVKIKRMAEILRTNVNTLVPEMQVKEFDEHYFMAKAFWKFMTQNFSDGIKGEPTNGRDITVLTDTSIHIDGEAYDVRPLTKVSTALVPNKIMVLK